MGSARHRDITRPEAQVWQENGRDQSGVFMATVLIVDDEPNIVQLATLYLERDGYRVSGASSGIEGLKKQEEMRPDIVILDLMLPDIDGFEVCRRLRSKSSIPILMLTARKEDIDKIVGLELGADDYLTKPFNPRELVARVRAILRRSTGAREVPGVMRVGELVIDTDRHEVKAGGKPIVLRSKEFALLSAFAQSPGLVFTREKLLEMVWGYDYFGETRTVDVHVNHVREKIGGSGVDIETIRGTGYRLIEQAKDS